MASRERKRPECPAPVSGMLVATPVAEAPGSPQNQSDDAMEKSRPSTPRHPVFSRRDMLQAGTIGLMGLSLPELHALQAAQSAGSSVSTRRAPRAVIYVLPLGWPRSARQLRSQARRSRQRSRRKFHAHPHADGRDPHLPEHLPRLAECSDKWALVRSLSHPTNDHSLGHHIMLTGRSEAPTGFSPARPNPTDFPSIATVAGRMLRQDAGHLPAAAVLPFHLIHSTGRVIPGQYAGMMGAAS